MSDGYGNNYGWKDTLNDRYTKALDKMYEIGKDKYSNARLNLNDRITVDATLMTNADKVRTLQENRRYFDESENINRLEGLAGYINGNLLDESEDGKNNVNTAIGEMNDILVRLRKKPLTPYQISQWKMELLKAKDGSQNGSNSSSIDGSGSDIEISGVKDVTIPDNEDTSNRQFAPWDMSNWLYGSRYTYNPTFDKPFDRTDPLVYKLSPREQYIRDAKLVVDNGAKYSYDTLVNLYRLKNMLNDDYKKSWTDNNLSRAAIDEKRTEVDSYINRINELRKNAKRNAYMEKAIIRAAQGRQY